jgi:flagellar basal body rod protein FlgG
MAAQQARFEILAANLANVDTPGFKRALLSVAAGQEQPVCFRATSASKPQVIGALASGVQLADPRVDLAQAPVRETGRPLDAAILDDAFFVVSSGGRNAYTRAGAFQVSPDGTLVDLFGSPAVGVSGKPISIPQGTPADDVRIGTRGEVLVRGAGGAAAGYTQIDRLQLVRLDPATVQPLGHRLYDGTAKSVPDSEVRLQPEALEGSNVGLVGAMVEMIEAYRAYEANARALQALNDIQAKTIEALG